MNLRLISASVLALSLAACATVATSTAGNERNSTQVRATAVAGDAAYAKPNDAILAADLDAVLSRARVNGAPAATNAAIGALLVMDELAAGRPSSAESLLDTLPERYRNGTADLLEPWVLLRQERAADAIERARDSASRMPGNLGSLFVPLVAESAGDLALADAEYDRLLTGMDKTVPPEDEPTSLEEALRALSAPQTTQILYRAALVKHRTGDRAAAEDLYKLVDEFAPNSPDVITNRARLARGEQPVEPTLDAIRGLGRWALFLSEEFGRSEGLEQVLSDPVPQQGLQSPTAALLAQMGIALDPSAHDWTIGAAYSLLEADGYAGAERIFRRVPQDSVYAPDATLGLAEVALEREDKSRATDEAQRAMRAAPSRWGVALSAGSVMMRAGADAQAMRAFDAALARAPGDRERASALISRAAAHNFFGRVDSALADSRAAVAADSRPAVKIAAIGLMLEAPNGWSDAVSMGRELLAAKPDSVARLNQLGYTLIHRPEGLEEGFRLLSRGVALGENDYAVIDSLGWAYYLYGDFDEAERYIKRAHELSPEPIAEILDHLGDIYWRQGRQDEARETWRAALDAQPEQLRRIRLEGKVKDGLTTPAPERRTPPTITPFTPSQRSDT